MWAGYRTWLAAVTERLRKRQVLLGGWGIVCTHWRQIAVESFNVYGCELSGTPLGQGGSAGIAR